MKKLSIGSAFESATNFYKENYEYLLPFTLLYFLFMMPGQFINSPFLSAFSILLIPLSFSIQYFADQKMQGKEVSFKTFFEFYKVCLPFLLALLVKVVLYLIILLPILIVFSDFIMNSNIDFSKAEDVRIMIENTQIKPIYSVVVLINLLLILILTPFMEFFEYYVVFGKKSIPQALKLSFQSGKENFFQIVLMILLITSVLFLGLLACVIGVIFTFPLALLIYYFSFKELEIDPLFEINN